MPNHLFCEKFASHLPSLRAVLGAALLLSPAAVLRGDDAPVWNDVTPAGLADPKTTLQSVEANNVFVYGPLP